MANWEADNDQRWVLPFGAEIGKMFKMGNLPVDFNVQGYYNSVKPEDYADWQLRAQLKLIFATGKKK